MATPKAKTLQQKLGFFDDDLRKPDHDTILKWLDLNIDSVIEKLYNFEKWNEKKKKKLLTHVNEIVSIELDRYKAWVNELRKEIKSSEEKILDLEKSILIDIEEKKKNPNEYSSSTHWKKDDIKELKKVINESIISLNEKESFLEYLEKFDGLGAELPERTKPIVTERQWEYPVTNQNINQRTGYKSSKSIIGFVDMKVTFKYTELTVTGIDFHNQQINGELKWSQTEYVDGNINIQHNYNIFIEVKTKIPSLGELFRQLNTYREYLTGDFLVVSPDDSNVETIRNQGFRFFKYVNKNYAQHAI